MAKTQTSNYSLNPDGKFVIKNYNHTKPFSNFFPGIAGLWGIPMWVFYVNRGQGISSFGIESKDKAILEFQAANKAYRLTPLQGFRTFLKITSGGKTIFYEPFQNNLTLKPYKTSQSMAVSAHDLTLEDINHTLGIKIEVNYFTVPQEPFAALIRQVRVINLSKKKYDIEMIDGLPAVVPFGLNDGLLKNMPRTAEAWVQVDYLKNKTPFYRLKVVISDKPEVTHISEGNFYFGFEASTKKLLEPLADPGSVFGASLDFAFPEIFVNSSRFKIPSKQQTDNQTLCAMNYSRYSLKPDSEKHFISAFGYAAHDNQLKNIVAKVTQRNFVEEKAEQNKEIIDGIRNFALTVSSSAAFDLYAQQTFLDNVLRGGLPVSFKTQEGSVTFHVYSRKHGDPERDYNYFVLSPTFLSQGNGNYRDVNQNRRNDVWFNSAVGQDNIVNFLNLVQPDGYNPLIIKGTTFSVDDPSKIEMILKKCVAENGAEKVQKFLHEGFQPGQLLKAVHQQNIKLKVSAIEFLTEVMSCCHKHEVAEHGEGFWTDHWTYNLDLIESYLAIYPDKLKELLLGRRDFTFYHNSHYVLPRDQRYSLTPRGVRQYESVKHASKETKAHAHGNKLRTNHGNGEIYHTQLLSKLLCLIANKVATLDPSGIGVEMEADKPNWYDALNGLPGLLGSSISETLEIQRLAVFLSNALQEISGEKSIHVFSELFQFIRNLTELLASDPDVLSYWQKSNDLKEQYRLSVRVGIDGKEESISMEEILRFLQLVTAKTEKSFTLAQDNKGRLATYFTHEVTEFQKLDRTDHTGFTHVHPTAFKVHPLPLFLEGFVHALRVKNVSATAREIYQKVKASELFDRKLKMYKVNSNLSAESEEIGRSRIFPQGWLENESIWLHMEYKFLLEVLRCGLYEEFYQEMKNTFIPFQNPQRYGRSILESSSFIVSSAHHDTDLHGQGFVARLSGSTAEFLHMWLLMSAGVEPFSVDKNGKLTLRFQPALAGWLFTKKEETSVFYDETGKCRQISIPKNSYAFKFLGSTMVVYHNPKRRDTFGKNKVSVVGIRLSYPDRKDPVVLSSEIIPEPYSKDVREHRLKQIDVFLE